MAHENLGFMYTRIGIPTVTALKEKIALLEGGEGCVAFSSGMEAISGTMLTILSREDHLIADKVLYGCHMTFLKIVGN